MYRNASFWFAGLLAVIIAGFWPSYFSPAAPEATFGQHFHSVTMLGWMLMLIAQAWLIRTRKRGAHRIIGRVSLVWVPFLVYSALFVVLDNLVGFEQPFAPIAISFFWLGLATAAYFTILYVLAIVHRKDMQLHARYMAATALAFVVPGTGRLFSQVAEATGWSFLGFTTALWVPAVVGVVMLVHEARKQRVRSPWILATVLQLVTAAGFFIAPRFGWFGTFAEWYAGFA